MVVPTAWPVDALHLVLHAAVALPGHGLAALQAGQGLDAHLLARHEGRVEPKAEMADELLVVVLKPFQEIAGPGEGHLVDVLLHLFGRHAHAVVREGEGCAPPCLSPPRSWATPRQAGPWRGAWQWRRSRWRSARARKYPYPNTAIS